MNKEDNIKSIKGIKTELQVSTSKNLQNTSNVDIFIYVHDQGPFHLAS